MTEAAMIEAIRAVGGAGTQQMAPAQVPAAADPAAVDAFQAAMSANGAEQVVSVPFADRVAGAWRTAQDIEQTHLLRMRSIVDPGENRLLSATELVNLQYELATMKFNMEVTMTVARKTSDAITTLVKNG